MFRRRVLLSLAVFAALIPAAVLAAEGRPPLAASLPADATAAYAHVDLKRTLAEADKGLTFVDPTAAEKIRFQIKDLYSMVRELAGQYDIKPALIDHIAETDVDVVVMAKEKPQTVTRTLQMPKFNKETFEVIPGETEDVNISETSYYTASLVLRTPSDEVASDFVDQFKALLDRRREKAQAPDAYKRTDIQVDKGQLVSQGEGHLTVGCLDDKIVISNGNPKELWAALMAPPSDKLSDTPMYQKMVSSGGGVPEASGMANLALLLQNVETRLKAAIDEAQKKAGESQTPQGQFDMSAVQLQVAQASYNAYLTAKKLFSLDKLQWAGAGAYFTASEDRAASTSYALLSHGQPISPLLSEIVNGSGTFQPPNVGKPGCMAILVRVDVGRIINEAINSISTMGGQIGMMLQMQMQQMKAQLGVGVDDLLKLPASDFYIYMDVVEKDVEESSWAYDEKTQQWAEKKTKVHKVLPDISVFWGVKDPSAARDTLDKLVTGLSTNPDSNAFVKKRNYQGTDVYCFGPGVTDEGAYPDGEKSFAFVIVDRYLTMGSWDDVTKAVRQLGSAGSKTDPKLTAVVQAHPDANFLAVVPKAFQEKNQKLSAKMSGVENVFDMLAKGIEGAELGLQDKDLEKRIKTALSELLHAYQTISLKSTEHAPDQVVVVGRPDGNFYEFSCKAEVTK